MAGSGLNTEWGTQGGTQEGTCPVPGTVREGGVLLEQRDLSDVPHVRVCKMRI